MREGNLCWIGRGVNGFDDCCPMVRVVPTPCENGGIMLGNADLIAFVPTRDPQKSRRFYEQTLGLDFISEDPFAMVFSAKGVTLRIANVSNVKDFKPAPFTILGWRVFSAQSSARALRD